MGKVGGLARRRGLAPAYLIAEIVIDNSPLGRALPRTSRSSQRGDGGSFTSRLYIGSRVLPCLAFHSTNSKRLRFDFHVGMCQS